MNRLKYLMTLILGVALLASCNLNEAPKFDDKDAFAAFKSEALSIPESGVKGNDTLRIPVLLTSLSGINGSVDFELEKSDKPGVAKEGVNYTLLNTSKTLNFTKEAPLQYISIKVIDNDTFDGDVSFSVKLTNPKSVKLGAAKTCFVTITDDEHPLKFILGTFKASGETNWDKPAEWKIMLTKDADDLSKVWIYNLVPEGSGDDPIYGVVNAEKTILTIPVGQTIAVSASYPKIILEGKNGETGEDIPTGGVLTCTISPDGNTITIKDWFGSAVYNAADKRLGYFNAIKGGAVLKK